MLGDRPTVLDVGCGTGAVLDLGVTTPDRYTGVDPSAPMLNELLVKYDRQRFAGIIPSRIEDALEQLRDQKFDLVIAAFGSASYFEPFVMDSLLGMASGCLVLMAYTDGHVPSLHDQPLPLAAETTKALRSLAAEWGVELRRLGRFDVVAIGARVS